MEVIVFSSRYLERISLLTAISFILALLWTPLWAKVLFRFRLGKKIAREGTTIYNQLHQAKENTPTMGGILIWVTTALVTLLFNLSREATWLPLFTLILTGLLGAFDDLLNIFRKRGLRARHKLFWQLLIAGLGAWWFYVKLGWGEKGIHIPSNGDISIGLWYIPLFILVIVSTMNAVNITDGLDGLAGGLLGFAYFAYGVIALVQGQVGIAAFCGTIVGALLAFLWFNIYPARFFMGDTGSMALGATLGVIALLTNSVVILPVIGFVFVIETLSVMIQVFYRKLTGGKKVFLSAPLHLHLQAKGWPEPKVVMRLWVLGAVFSVIGLAIGLFGK